MATNSKEYDFRQIEPHWQSFWEKNQTFKAVADPSRPKYYILDMFPYPSGAGLHLGHCENYAITDIMARYQRAREPMDEAPMSSRPRITWIGATDNDRSPKSRRFSDSRSTSAGRPRPNK